MSFTEDELQAFNAILDQRLQAHRRDMERVLDRQVIEYRREMEQRLYAIQQDIGRSLTTMLAGLQQNIEASLSEKLQMQQALLSKTFNQEREERDSQLAALAAYEDFGMLPNGHHMEEIEVQTELPWDDLLDIIGKALSERLSVLSDELKRLEKNIEQLLSTRLYSLQDTLTNITHVQHHSSAEDSPVTADQMMLGIEHLERVVESLQVVMTANHALLSDRLYSHQQLPVERAHPVRQAQPQRITEEKQQPALPDASESAEIASTNP